MKPIASQMAAASTIYALVGPPLGALLINVYFLWPLTRPTAEYFSGGMMLIGLMSVVVGYLVGAVPAALAGAAYAYVACRFGRHVLHPLAKVVVSGVIGFVATYFPLLLYFGFTGQIASGLLWPSLIGAAVSCMCALALHAAGALPNNSSKPTPLRGAA